MTDSDLIISEATYQITPDFICYVNNAIFIIQIYPSNVTHFSPPKIGRFIAVQATPG